MKNKYELLDGFLVDYIAVGYGFKQLVNTAEIKAEAFNSVRNPDDVLNGRLQSLRKRGKIECVKGRWRVVTPLLSPTQVETQKHDLF